MTQNDCELLVEKLSLNSGFEIFQYIYGDNERKKFILNIVSKLEENKMKRRISALFCFMLFSILHGQESPIIRAEVILPATRFPADLKHKESLKIKSAGNINFRGT